MTKPKILILSGYGLNCEDETSLAFSLASGESSIIHINDLIANKKTLDKYQILAIPGGFSFGDDTGSGRAYANKLNNHLADALKKFASQDKLIIGICNGFQILTQIGLLPGALLHNKNPRYLDRWVDVKIPEYSSSGARSAESRSTKGSPQGRTIPSPWLQGISSLSLPIAHGEGNFYASKEDIAIIQKQQQIAGVYTQGEICTLQSLEPNPNGSMLDIAMLTSANGKILGSMPHPERAMFFTQLPHWTLLKEKLIRTGKKLPQFGPGLEVFKNGVNYFK
jgi:phosphoribosylformylglycinamidine synthase